MEGLVLPALPWVPPDDRETRMVEGVQPVAPMQVSRTKMSATPFASPLTRLSASEPKATKRPLLLMVGLLLAALPWLPPEATETRMVEGGQPPPAPRQVSRTKTSATPFKSLATRLVAEEENAMKRPSGVMAGAVLEPLSASAPAVEIETREVSVVQPPPAPVQVSRTKTSRAPLVSLATRLLARERKATKRPSELMAGSELVELPSAPPVEIETRRVLRAQPSSPRQVSRQKTSVTPLPSLATRLLASEVKARYRPLPLAAGAPLAAAPSMPLASRLERSTRCGAPGVTVNLSVFDSPPSGTSLNTVTRPGSGMSRSAEKMSAVSCVALPNVVVRSSPFQRTTDVGMNPLPLTVSVKAGSSAVAVSGESDVMSGTGLVALEVMVTLTLSETAKAFILARMVSRQPPVTVSQAGGAGTPVGAV